jgi:2-amino-4-hydroxy-6-hydroxymethyldihydropteridine diphosphokinase
MSRAFISLGSNLGDRGAHLQRALDALRATRGIQWIGMSRIYETDPVGPPPQGPYLNAVAELETGMEPRALLERLLQIEAEEGRVRGGVRGEARILDLDLLLFADCCIDEDGLVVPHPRMHERGFVLEPLCELAPQRVHPRSGETVAELAARVRDPAAVRLWGKSREGESGRGVVIEQFGEEDPDGPAIRSRGARVAASAVVADDSGGVLQTDAGDLVGSPGGVENGLGDPVGQIAALD